MIYVVRPLLGSALVHVSHSPMYFCLLIQEVIGTEAEVGLAYSEKTYLTESPKRIRWELSCQIRDLYIFKTDNEILK